MQVKKQDNSQGSHDEKLRVLIRKRKDITDKMANLTQKRYLLEVQPRIKLQQQGEPRKIVKLDSKDSFSQLESAPGTKTQGRVRSSSNIPQNQFTVQQTEPIKRIQEQNINRNKRMFQGLVMHLSKAQNKLKEQKQKITEQNRLQNKIQLRQRENSQKNLQQELSKINTEFVELEKLKNQNAKQVLKIQNLILLQSYTQYMSAIKPFTFTRTEPPISWKPTKDIELAKKLLNHRENQIEEKNKKIVDSIESYESKFECSFYFLQNEKEYYDNYLEAHFKDSQNFIRTETEPPLMWKPASTHKSTPQLLNNSKNKVKQILEHSKAICQKYYQEKVTYLRQRKVRGQHDQGDNDSHSQTPRKQEQE